MDSSITYIRVHPGIGIARLGNSGDGAPELKLGENFFVGPEAEGIVVDPGGSGGNGPDGGTYRDGEMGLKRQAQRYRIYGYNAAGEAVSELTSADAEIEEISWRVHARNVKAANYAFQGAYLLDNTQMRNPNIQGPGKGETMNPDDRDELIIDAGVQTISTEASGEKTLAGDCFFDSEGQLDAQGNPVKYYLPAQLDYADGSSVAQGFREVQYKKATGIEIGRLKLDDTGRLLFIAGPGKAVCVTTPKINLSNPSEKYNPPNGDAVTGAPDGNDHAYQPLINQFAYFNVPGWWDDTCGAEIDVTVKLRNGAVLSTRDGVSQIGDDGTRNAKKGGWVVTAPPKYAPDMYHVVSIKDRVFEAFPEADPSLAEGEGTEFWRDVYPILARAVNYGWVSEEAGGVTPENRNLAHGPKQAGNLLSDRNMTAFVDPDVSFNATRNQIWKIMRQADLWQRGSNDKNYPDPITPMQMLAAGFPRLIDTLPEAPPPASAPLPGDETSMRTARGNKMPKLWGTAGKPLQNQQLGHDLPNQYLSLTANSLAHLQNWGAGTFTNTYLDRDRDTSDPNRFAPPAPLPLEDYPVEAQPMQMDCAAVEPTIGGGFHPGIEFPYLICYRAFFEEAFRVAAGTTPGSVAAYMSSPWQGDYWSCNVAWWPVQRPDIVFTYHGPDQPRTYCEWFRGYDEDGNVLSQSDGYNQMVYAWDKLGMVLPLRDDDGTTVKERGSVVFQEYERDPALSTHPGKPTIECDDDAH